MTDLHLKKTKPWGEDVFSLLSWFDLKKTNEAKVLVAGAGALGNEVLKNLALFGVGNIVVIDFDTIEYSNLSRSVLFRPEDAKEKKPKVEVAAQRLKEINPEINITPIYGDLGPEIGLGLFRDADVVIGCLDNRYARYLINLHCFRANKSWVDAGIENLEGYVRVFKPGVNCYECNLTDQELEHIAIRTGCPDIAKTNVSQGRIATTPVSASIMGAIQVQEALKIIHEPKENKTDEFNTLVGKLLKYEGMFLSFKTYKMESFDDDCMSHEEWSPVINVEELSADTTVKEALEILKRTLQTSQVVLNLRNNMFIKSITTEEDDQQHEVMIPESEIDQFLSDNPLGFDLTKRIFQDYVENIGDDFLFQHFTLKQIGFPYYDIIQVSTSRGISYVELTADKSRYF